MLCLNNINIVFHKKILECPKLVFPDTGLCIIKGKSGSGKSSLLNCLLMKNHFYDSYKYNNQEMTHELVEEKISILSQSQCFIDDLLVIDHIKLIENTYNFKGSNEYINTLCLKHLLYKYPSQLSGGEKTRVGLLLHLIKQPEILILDEPTSSLDLYYTNIVLKLLEEYSLNHLVIVASHDTVIINHADYLYEIINQSILFNDTYNHSNNCLQTTKQNFSIPLLKLNLWLKKKNKLYYFGIYSLFIILILFCSFGLSLSFGEKKGNNTFSSIYQDEVLVYKSKFPLSGSGLEYPLTQSEINELKSIKHIEDVDETYIYNNITDIVTENNSMLNLTDQDLLNLSVYEDGKNIKTINYSTNGVYYGSFGYCSYNENYDYSNDIEIILDNKDNGVFISKAVADLFGIKYNGNDYEIEFYLMIPTHQIYGDAIIPYQNSDGSFGPEGDPVLEWMGVKEKIKLPINGILKSSQMGVGINQHMSLFFPNQLIKNKIKQHENKQTYSYYYDDSQGAFYYRRGIKNGKKIIVAKPYSPILYRLKLDNLSYIEEVKEEVKSLGLSVTTGDYNIALRTYENNTDTMILFISAVLLVILSFIYLVIEYLRRNIYCQIVDFIQTFGIYYSTRIISKMNFINFLLLQCIILIIGVLYSFIIGPMLKYPIHFTYTFIPISFVMSFIIFYLIPLSISKLRK